MGIRLKAIVFAFTRSILSVSHCVHWIGSRQKSLIPMKNTVEREKICIYTHIHIYTWYLKYTHVFSFICHLFPTSFFYTDFFPHKCLVVFPLLQCFNDRWDLCRARSMWAPWTTWVAHMRLIAERWLPSHAHDSYGGFHKWGYPKTDGL